MLVVKVGGRALQNIQEIIVDLASIIDGSNARVVLVHGGGDIVTEYAKKLGIEPRFVVSPSGIRSRYTTLEELEVFTMVMAGKLNKEIVRIAYSKGVQALGVSGADCSLLTAERKEKIIVINEKGRPQVIPGGYTGRVIDVNKTCLERLLEATRLLVVAPLAMGVKGELLNIDADQAAEHIASALKPDTLVFLTDRPGVILEDKTLGVLTASQAEEILPRIGAGMNRKLLSAIKAVRQGAKKAVIANGLQEKPVTRALQGQGTIIVPDTPTPNP